jgi:S1-C subfamily serine protease
MPVINSTMTIKTMRAMGGYFVSFIILLSLSLISSIPVYDVTHAKAQTLQSSNNASSNTQGLSLPELYSSVSKSVVQVSAVNQTDPFAPSLGTGFIYDNVGHVITSSSSIAPANNTRVSVTFSDGTIYRGRVIGMDEFNDLAVLLIEDQVPADKLIPLPIGNSTELRIGEQIATIGYPLGGISSVLTTGIVAQMGFLLPIYNASSEASVFSIPDTIVTDLASSAGNSGGPLFNMQGEVVGMTISTTETPSAISFSVPSSTISRVAPVLIEGGLYQHPWLGFAGTDITPEIAETIGLEEPRGFLVIETEPGGPVDRAGIRGGNTSTQVEEGEITLGGDVILAIDDRDVRNIDDLLSYMEHATKVGDTVTVTVWREGQIIEIPVTVGVRPNL